MSYPRAAGAVQYLLAVLIKLFEVQMAMSVYCTGNWLIGRLDSSRLQLSPGWFYLFWCACQGRKKRQEDHLDENNLCQREMNLS